MNFFTNLIPYPTQEICNSLFKTFIPGLFNTADKYSDVSSSIEDKDKLKINDILIVENIKRSLDINNFFELNDVILNPNVTTDFFLSTINVKIRYFKIGSMKLDFPKTYLTNPFQFTASDIIVHIEFQDKSSLFIQEFLKKPKENFINSTLNKTMNNLRALLLNIGISLYLNDTLLATTYIDQIRYNFRETKFDSIKPSLNIKYQSKINECYNIWSKEKNNNKSNLLFIAGMHINVKGVNVKLNSTYNDQDYIKFLEIGQVDQIDIVLSAKNGFYCVDVFIEEAFYSYNGIQEFRNLIGLPELYGIRSPYWILDKQIDGFICTLYLEKLNFSMTQAFHKKIFITNIKVENTLESGVLVSCESIKSEDDVFSIKKTLKNYDNKCFVLQYKDYSFSCYFGTFEINLDYISLKYYAWNYYMFYIHYAKDLTEKKLKGLFINEPFSFNFDYSHLDYIFEFFFEKIELSIKLEDINANTIKLNYSKKHKHRKQNSINPDIVLTPQNSNFKNFDPNSLGQIEKSDSNNINNYMLFNMISENSIIYNTILAEAISKKQNKNKKSFFTREIISDIEKQIKFLISNLLNYFKTTNSKTMNNNEWVKLEIKITNVLISNENNYSEFDIKRYRPDYTYLPEIKKITSNFCKTKKKYYTTVKINFEENELNSDLKTKIETSSKIFNKAFSIKGALVFDFDCLNIEISNKIKHKTFSDSFNFISISSNVIEKIIKSLEVGPKNQSYLGINNLRNLHYELYSKLKIINGGFKLRLTYTKNSEKTLINKILGNIFHENLKCNGDFDSDQFKFSNNLKFRAVNRLSFEALFENEGQSINEVSDLDNNLINGEEPILKNQFYAVYCNKVKFTNEININLDLDLMLLVPNFLYCLNFINTSIIDGAEQCLNLINEKVFEYKNINDYSFSKHYVSELDLVTFNFKKINFIKSKEKNVEFITTLYDLNISLFDYNEKSFVDLICSSINSFYSNYNQVKIENLTEFIKKERYKEFIYSNLELNNEKFFHLEGKMTKNNSKAILNKLKTNDKKKSKISTISNIEIIAYVKNTVIVIEKEFIEKYGLGLNSLILQNKINKKIKENILKSLNIGYYLGNLSSKFKEDILTKTFISKNYPKACSNFYRSLFNREDKDISEILSDFVKEFKIYSKTREFLLDQINTPIVKVVKRDSFNFFLNFKNLLFDFKTSIKPNSTPKDQIRTIFYFSSLFINYKKYQRETKNDLLVNIENLSVVLLKDLTHHLAETKLHLNLSKKSLIYEGSYLKKIGFTEVASLSHFYIKYKKYYTAYNSNLEIFSHSALFKFTKDLLSSSLIVVNDIKNFYMIMNEKIEKDGRSFVKLINRMENKFDETGERIRKETYFNKMANEIKFLDNSLILNKSFRKEIVDPEMFEILESYNLHFSKLLNLKNEINDQSSLVYLLLKSEKYDSLTNKIVTNVQIMLYNINRLQ